MKLCFFFLIKQEECNTKCNNAKTSPRKLLLLLWISIMTRMKQIIRTTTKVWPFHDKNNCIAVAERSLNRKDIWLEKWLFLSSNEFYFYMNCLHYLWTPNEKVIKKTQQKLLFYYLSWFLYSFFSVLESPNAMDCCHWYLNCCLIYRNVPFLRCAGAAPAFYHNGTKRID